MEKTNLKIQIISLIGFLLLFGGISQSSNAGALKKVGANIEIDLKADSVVNGSKIKIRDIATVASADIDLSLFMDDLVIGNAPWPGNSRTIELSEIMTIMLNRGIDLSKVNFVGANEVNVTVRSLTISSDQIVKHATAYLRSKLSEDEDVDVVLELQQLPRDQVVPLGDGDVKLRFARVGMGRSKKQAYLSAKIIVDGDVYKSIGMMYNVNLFKNVVVAKRNIKKGDVVSGDLVRMETVETTRLTVESFDSVDEVVGKVASRSISSGNVVTKDVVKNISAVKKGDSVIILIGTAGFEIASKGICQQNGGFGDLVRVVNVDTKKVLYGNVINGGTVRIQF